MNRVFGSDPEFAIYKTNEDVDGIKVPKLIPPMALIEDYGFEYQEGKDGMKILHEHILGNVIEDGAAIEINLKPTTEYSDIVKSTKSVLKDFIEIMRLKKINMACSKYPYAYFDTDEYWKKRNEDFRTCVIFGCDPDFFPEVYKDMGLELPDNIGVVDVSEHTGRYFGGHLHIQNMTNNPNIYTEQAVYAGIVFDFLVGTMNTTFARTSLQRKLELKRLEYYGRPGHARIQKYSDELNGFEYRPLSNYWIFDLLKAKKVLATATVAADIVEYGLAELFYLEFMDDIPDMWNSLVKLDHKMGKELLGKSLIWALDNNLATLDILGDCA